MKRLNYVLRSFVLINYLNKKRKSLGKDAFYWMDMRTLTHSSGLTWRSDSSTPISILTQLIFPLNLLLPLKSSDSGAPILSPTIQVSQLKR